MLGELEWPSLEALREQSSLLLFHCVAVPIEKDKHVTPAQSLKTTRSSHSAKYRRHHTYHYSDALKNSSPPELFHIGKVCLHMWLIPSPQGNLGHFLFKPKYRPFFCVFYLFVIILSLLFVVVFYQNF